MSEDGLPGELPEGFTFVSGMEVKVLQGGATVSPLPAGASVIPSFDVSDGVEGVRYVILHWNGSGWDELTGEEVEAFFKTESVLTGIFVLATK